MVTRLQVPIHAVRFQYGSGPYKRWSKYHIVKEVIYGQLVMACNIKHRTIDDTGDLIDPTEALGLGTVEREEIISIPPAELCEKCLGPMKAVAVEVAPTAHVSADAGMPS